MMRAPREMLFSDPWRSYREERRDAMLAVLEDLERQPAASEAAAASAALLRHLVQFPARRVS